MKTSYPTLALIGFLILTSTLAAQIPPPPPSPGEGKPADEKTTKATTSGKIEEQEKPLVLLLSDFKIAKGMVSRGEGYYRLRNGKDLKIYGEAEVKFVAEDLDQVRKYLESRSKQPEPIEQAAGVDSQTLNAYPTRIEPILMNKCADCHAAKNHGSRFKLEHVERGFVDAAATKGNLSRVLEFTSGKTASANPLVKFASTAHGGLRSPPLDARHPALRTLREWTGQLATTENVR